MTHEDFIKWLDKEMADAEKISKNTALPDDARTFQNGKLSVLYEAKGRFLSLFPPPTTLN